MCFRDGQMNQIPIRDLIGFGDSMKAETSSEDVPMMLFVSLDFFFFFILLYSFIYLFFISIWNLVIFGSE